MYHLHTLIHMSYAHHQICLTRQGNTTTIEAPFLGSGCSRVVQGAGRKAKRMVLQCINGVGSNPVEGRRKNLTALKSNSNTVWFNFQTYIYIYIQYTYIVELFQTASECVQINFIFSDNVSILCLSCNKKNQKTAKLSENS